jgi:hypothetical protein
LKHGGTPKQASLHLLNYVWSQRCIRVKGLVSDWRAGLHTKTLQESWVKVGYTLR